MDDEDYLGITALALSYLAEDFIKSTDSKNVKPILMFFVAKASADWQKEKEKIKEPLLTEVKSSIDKSVEWLQIRQQKKPQIKRWKKGGK
ncbi:hypothetical protein NO976_02569 [Planktothrix agardhii]|jgi:hypothetical protein|uniref:hypothetical protein n=1 Tax=Planktothrix agardhii TaxID=1160 RepID=UPI0020A76643|nr:hypothetical protein [Planktothrix agardhii]CAD5950220.1 hypothetical protein NO976_02569 [Planktothrix agardhii]